MNFTGTISKIWGPTQSKQGKWHWDAEVDLVTGETQKIMVWGDFNTNKLDPALNDLAEGMEIKGDATIKQGYERWTVKGLERVFGTGGGPVEQYPPGPHQTNRNDAILGQTCMKCASWIVAAQIGQGFYNRDDTDDHIIDNVIKMSNMLVSRFKEGPPPAEEPRQDEEPPVPNDDDIPF